MKKGNKVIFALFDLRSQVDVAVDALKNAGFRSSDVSVLMAQMGEDTLAVDKSTKAPEGATVGGGAGAVLGGALGWLVGIGAVALTPALAPMIAAGPIMAALAGVAVGGAVGGVTGALVGLGLPEFEAKRYENFLKEGGILLSVHVDDHEWAMKAKDLLKTYGARDISFSTEEGEDRPQRPFDQENTTSIF